ncbi:LppA family lipoprotein [Amycolatopsis sacchari]|uniref:Lipoprotein n=1 Tax=Amycolatopsis sacchari TaxID=115433 RepID=A0A1I3LTJ1_9PSEU|nr:LppA family lipoprotein [Amycolatopsis sacchari]SFI88061.1 Lipoprotein [Amycolatopsis sacchari]
MNRLIRVTLAGLTAAALVLELTGCGGNDRAGSPMSATPDPNRLSQQFADLLQRPDIDQATARYEEMSGHIRDALSGAFPDLRWRQTSQLTGAACGFGYPGLETDGEQRGLPNWMAPGSIPDGRWDEAVRVVRTVALKYGFDKVVTTVGRPTDHEVVFSDPYDAELNFGSAVNTTLLVRTGCHLTPEAKKRGHPTSSPAGG